MQSTGYHVSNKQDILSQKKKNRTPAMWHMYLHMLRKRDPKSKHYFI